MPVRGWNGGDGGDDDARYAQGVRDVSHADAIDHGDDVLHGDGELFHDDGEQALHACGDGERFRDDDDDGGGDFDDVIHETESAFLECDAVDDGSGGGDRVPNDHVFPLTHGGEVGAAR